MEKTLSSSEALEFCNKIELTDFNQIQSHGALFALDNQHRIIQYSENVATLLHTPARDLINQPVTNFLLAELPEDNIDHWLSQSSTPYKRLMWAGHDATSPVLAYLYKNNDETILEIEPSHEKHSEHTSLFDLTQYVIASMKSTMASPSIHELAQRTCEEIQKITHFDRVIIYQFDPIDQSGIVIGEVLGNGKEMEPYLGLRFPANDIPQSVRAMYLKLPLRYIPSILDEPVSITPQINPISKKPLDLSCANLRMVAPVHIKYMTNMHIQSATSIGIIQHGKLWGLIACHHKTPKYLSLNHRLILLLIANTIANQNLTLECTTDFRDEARTVELQSSLTANISKTDSLSYALESYHNELMELVSATGMSFYFQGILINYGETPTNEQLTELIPWLDTKNIQGMYATSKLPCEYESSLAYKHKACGLLAIKITDIESNYILFYKPERIDTVVWAGNPSETLKCSASSYSPRNSFERFLETINNQSAPWTNHEMRSAKFIRSIVTNKQLQDLLQVQAMHDPLTKLLNRLYLEQRLSLEIQRCTRDGKPLALILADLDFFKKINDQYGHQAGDQVLSEFAHLLQTHFRGYDYIYRYGGEEFLVLLPGVDYQTAAQKAEALGETVKKMKIVFNDVTLPQLSLSAGISAFPNNGDDARSLIAAADGALYQAKRNGRDQVCGAAAREV